MPNPGGAFAIPLMITAFLATVAGVVAVGCLLFGRRDLAGGFAILSAAMVGAGVVMVLIVGALLWSSRFFQ